LPTFSQPSATPNIRAPTPRPYSYLQRLFFYSFGRFSYPSQAEIIITVDDIEGQKFPFAVPSLRNIV
jgi:hypothetical protein